MDNQSAIPADKTSSQIRRALSFRNISALYVFVAMFVLFAIWIPDTFLTRTNWITLLDSSALTALVAIALVIPLAAGSFNLAVGAEVGLGAIMVAWLLSTVGVPVVPAIALTLVAGLVVGLFNGLLIVKARIDSFIATLGVSSLLVALTAWLSDSQQILGLGSGFQSIATTKVLGITLPVYIMLAVALAAWYVLERTPTGRRVYATGGNPAAARLSGIRTSLVIIGTLVAGGMITAMAGLLISSRIATGDPTVGPAFLLPAFAAAFLGSTQFRGGRFNILGTVVAVYVLAMGVKGLQLAGAPIWIPSLFNGAALLIAVGLAKYERSAQTTGAIRRALRMDRGDRDREQADDRPLGAERVP